MHARRTFAEAMFERAKEAQRMSAGDWNVGSVITARGRRRSLRRARPPTYSCLLPSARKLPHLQLCVTALHSLSVERRAFSSCR
jgi:hypothetical protein